MYFASPGVSLSLTRAYERELSTQINIFVLPITSEGVRKTPALIRYIWSHSNRALPKRVTITVKMFHLLKKSVSTAELVFPVLSPGPDGDVSEGRTLAIKLSQAAIVALGQIVDPAVEPDPVNIGSWSAERTLLLKIEVVPPTRDPSWLIRPVVLERRMNSRTKMRALEWNEREIKGRKSNLHFQACLEGPNVQHLWKARRWHYVLGGQSLPIDRHLQTTASKEVWWSPEHLQR